MRNTSTMSYAEIKDYVDNSQYITEYGSITDLIYALNNDKRKNVNLLAQKLTNKLKKEKSEVIRVTNMYDFDLNHGKYLTIAGTDEVGRGPLAGPIAAAAVILNLNYDKDKSLILGIKDSKKLSPKKREELSEIIKEKALYYSISVLGNSIIDSKGISWSNNEVLLRSCCGLKFKPDLVLSDGYAVRNLNIQNKYIIKGDAKSASIACASIIAKVYRDNLMKEYAEVYPMYNFDHNMGYGTKEHIEAIKKYGPCKIHRMSFLSGII